MIAPRTALLAALALSTPAPAADPETSEPQKAEEKGPPPELQRIPREDRDCLRRAATTAPDDTPASTLRQWCYGSQDERTHTPAHDALRSRLALEESSQFNPFVITPHRRNYVLPWSNWSNRTWKDPDREDSALQPNEVKFQFSLKTPLWDDFFDDTTLYAGFTMTSFWQAYNKKVSRPFRETNYAPELFASRPVDWQLGPVDSELFTLGFVHESNGQSLPTSRGWNRIYADYVFRTGSWYFSVRPWYRIPEGAKDGPDDPEGDDNPNIEHYMGNFELTISRPFNNHVFDLTVRNNLASDNKGAGQIDYSFPLNDRFKGFFQVFTGYGDSLILYDEYVNRVSVGILLTDML